MKKKWNYMSLKPFNFLKEQLLVTISSFNQMHQIRELRTKMRMFNFIFFVLNKFRSLNTMPPWKAFSWFWRFWRFVWDFVIHSWFRLPVSITFITWSKILTRGNTIHVNVWPWCKYMLFGMSACSYKPILYIVEFWWFFWVVFLL